MSDNRGGGGQTIAFSFMRLCCDKLACFDIGFFAWLAVTVRYYRLFCLSALERVVVFEKETGVL